MQTWSKKPTILNTKHITIITTTLNIIFTITVTITFICYREGDIYFDSADISWKARTLNVMSVLECFMTFRVESRGQSNLYEIPNVSKCSLYVLH